MTLVPLSNKNFVKTTVKVAPKTTYVSASSDCNNFGELAISGTGISGSVFDREDFSKSIIPTKIDGKLKSTLNSTTKDIFSEGFSKEGSNIINELERIRTAEGENYQDEINANNFKNEFKIKRTIQNFLYGDVNLDKKNYVKNILYPFYRKNKDNDNLNNVYWGFSNYNSLNFFSQGFNSSYNYSSHSNCLAYPNFYTNNKYNYDFIKKDNFNVSFFINRRETGSITDQCILHIPKAFSIFLSNGSSTNTNTFGNINKYKIKTSIVQNDSPLSFSYSETTDCIKSNNWHYVSINFINTTNDSYRVDIYVDNNIIQTFTIDTIFKYSEFDNIILIGNKFNNYDELSINSNSIGDNSILRKRLFSSTGVNPVLNNKFINIEKSIDINSTNEDFFDKTKTMFSLEAELCDFRIYSNSLDIDKIKHNRKNGVKNVLSEILDSGLCFYLPLYFVPVAIFKEALYNASGETKKLTYTSPVNPYFSNFCGGHEVNVENFVFEFVRKQTPNIIIGGIDKNNFYKDTSVSSVNNLIRYKSGSNENDNTLIRKGTSVNEIYTKNLLDNSVISDNEKINNLIYRNNFILPNDNGIQKQYFNIISDVFSSNISNDNMSNTTGYESQYNFIENLEERNINTKLGITDQISKNYHVSMEKIYSDLNFNDLYKTRYKKNFFTKDNGIPYSDEFNNEERPIETISDIPYTISKDTLYSVSNLLYHNNIDIDTWTNSNTIVTEPNKDKYLNYYIDESNLSNPLTRKYKNIHTTQDYEENHIFNGLTYKSILLPFRDLMCDDSYFHSVIFDISSQIYNNKIKKGSFILKDVDLHGSNAKLKITLKDNYAGCLYRCDCETEVADWNYVGHIFYSEGISTILHPGIANFGGNNFTCEFESERSLFVNEINIPCESGKINKSYNSTYNEDLRASDSAFDHDEKFVYITDINLHDENLNIVAKAKLAQPVPKKSSDNIVFRLKMDY
tara:strand:+ start:2334 stop:5225 length:2892 start_codon:yes stop_codon:yes gene_type:complete